MRRLITPLACVLVGVAAGQSPSNHEHHRAQPHRSTVDPEFDGAPGVVTGYVRDVACVLRNQKAAAANTPESIICMRKCIAGSSPIGILASDGTLYTPISSDIPDVSVRTRLLPYVGKYVRASGKLFERGQLHAIAITEIKVAHEVGAH